MWSGIRTPTSSCVSRSVLILTTALALALTETASPSHLACLKQAVIKPAHWSQSHPFLGCQALRSAYAIVWH